LDKVGQDIHFVNVTLSRAIYAKPERLAKKHGLKVFWIVHRVADQFVEQGSRRPALPLGLGQLHA